MLRGFRHPVWLFFQSLEQLKRCYGDKAVEILDNIGTQQYFAINSLETATHLSKRIGDGTILTESYNSNVSRSRPTGGMASGEGGSFSTSDGVTHNEAGRPLIRHGRRSWYCRKIGHWCSTKIYRLSRQPSLIITMLLNSATAEPARAVASGCRPLLPPAAPCWLASRSRDCWLACRHPTRCDGQRSPAARGRAPVDGARRPARPARGVLAGMVAGPLFGPAAPPARPATGCAGQTDHSAIQSTAARLARLASVAAPVATRRRPLQLLQRSPPLMPGWSGKSGDFFSYERFFGWKLSSPRRRASS